MRRREKRKIAAVNASDLLTRIQPAKETPSAAYLYTSQTRQTYCQSGRGAFMMMCLVHAIEIPGWKEGGVGTRRLSEMKHRRNGGR
jgi:hypothetical protein